MRKETPEDTSNSGASVLKKEFGMSDISKLPKIFVETLQTGPVTHPGYAVWNERDESRHKARVSSEDSAARAKSRRCARLLALATHRAKEWDDDRFKCAG
eukprot:481720-Pleurochrysis_carterae.AAC.3